jgi:hypothetical protein
MSQCAGGWIDSDAASNDRGIWWGPGARPGPCRSLRVLASSLCGPLRAHRQAVRLGPVLRRASRQTETGGQDPAEPGLPRKRYEFRHAGTSAFEPVHRGFLIGDTHGDADDEALACRRRHQGV